MTTGSPTVGYDVIFWGTPASSARWVAASGLWKINSNGNPAGGLQTDNLMLRQNTISSLTGPLILDPATSVVIPATTPLQFGTVMGATSSVYGTVNGALQLTASKCINLNPQVAVTIPQGIPLWFDGTCSSAIDPIYRSGFLNRVNTGELVIGGAGGITLSNAPGQKIVLSTPNTALVFGPPTLAGSPTIQGDSMNGILNITGLNAIELTSPTILLPPNGKIAWNPHAISNYISGGNGTNNQAGLTLAGGDDNILVQSNQHIQLGPAQSVIIPGNEPLEFPGASTSLGVILTGNNNTLASQVKTRTAHLCFGRDQGPRNFPPVNLSHLAIASYPIKRFKVPELMS